MSQPPGATDRLVSSYVSGETLRSRSVSRVVLTGRVDVPVLPARLVADWQREVSQRLRLEPGDVEALPLPRARTRWPDYRQCVEQVADWTRSLGLGDVLVASELALMACRGARYHHDGAQYGGAAFCNLFLSDAKDMDLHFPAMGLRIPLIRGSVVIFDTGQPHAVIERSGSGFNAADFQPGRDCTQAFLTWELPIENPQVSQALQVAFDIETAGELPLQEEQLWRNGTPAQVCPATGRWI